jgi:hypothetical protein
MDDDKQKDQNIPFSRRTTLTEIWKKLNERYGEVKCSTENSNIEPINAFQSI